LKQLNWPTNKEMAAYMKNRRNQNHKKCLTNKNENWMFDILKTRTSYKWKRQSEWGYRIFDFWCHKLGVAVEVDGKEHDWKYDNYRDEYNFRRSGIIVLRVRNGSEHDATDCIETINRLNTHQERKAELGINANTVKGKRVLSSQPFEYSMLDKYLALNRNLF